MQQHDRFPHLSQDSFNALEFHALQLTTKYKQLIKDGLQQLAQCRLYPYLYSWNGNELLVFFSQVLTLTAEDQTLRKIELSELERDSCLAGRLFEFIAGLYTPEQEAICDSSTLSQHGRFYYHMNEEI